jgi:hypothetical protein
LPGPRTQSQDLDPQRKFWCEQEEGDLIVRTNAADLSWLSEVVSGMAMQKVRWSDADRRWCADEADPPMCRVEVKQLDACESRLKDLDVKVAQRLLGGSESYAIVTVNLDATGPDDPYEKIGDIIVQGRGNGVWEILGPQ